MTHPIPFPLSGAAVARRPMLIAAAASALAGPWAARSAQAAVTDIGDAINKAGRQRMLSQRMAKAYCQLGLGLVPEQSRKILTVSQQLFASQLVELTAFAPTPDIRQTYDELGRLWQPYRTLLEGKPGRDEARRVAALSEDVLRSAHLATTQLELHAGTSVGRLINIAGRQRMLSQRMAKFYMLRQWGISSAEMDNEAQIAQREFTSALAALEAAPENTAAVKDDLELARAQWVFFGQALRQQGAAGALNPVHATDVATTSERLLEVMDRVTGRYAALSAATAPAPARKR
jgi:nitrate/nitrite-specific signal transduction histidine kinase